AGPAGRAFRDGARPLPVLDRARPGARRRAAAGAGRVPAGWGPRRCRLALPAGFHDLFCRYALSARPGAAVSTASPWQGPPMKRAPRRSQPALPRLRAPRAVARPVRGLVLAAAACAARRPAQPGITPALAVATFDSAWAVIDRTHFDTTFNGVDWSALRDELRPRAAAARTQDELRAVIGEMLGRLRQSHFGLIPAERAAERKASADGGAAGDVGLELRLVGDDVVVFRVDEGSPAAEAGIRPGWVVRAVDDIDA